MLNNQGAYSYVSYSPAMFSPLSIFSMPSMNMYWSSSTQGRETTSEYYSPYNLCTLSFKIMLELFPAYLPEALSWPSNCVLIPTMISIVA